MERFEMLKFNQDRMRSGWALVVLMALLALVAPASLAPGQEEEPAASNQAGGAVRSRKLILTKLVWPATAEHRAGSLSHLTLPG